MIINGSVLKSLRQGFTSLYMAAMNTAEPKWQKVAMLVVSTTSGQNYGWMANTSSFREWLGDRVIQNLSAFEFFIKNRSFENTIGVGRDDIEDDNVGVYAPRFQQLGHDAATHPDELVFDLLVNGFTQPCYDGQNFFDTDHPVTDKDGIEQSVSNTGGGAGSPWFLLDTTKPIKPIIFQKRRDYEFVAMEDPDDTNVFMRKEFLYGVDARVAAGYALWQLGYGSKAALTADNFKAARTAMQTLTGDKGKQLKIMPNILVVGPTNQDAAEEIIKKARTGGGDTNTLQNAVEILVVPELG